MSVVFQYNRNVVLDNIRDSIFHALSHYSEISTDKANAVHHLKWIVLSIHHAVESYLKLILSEVDPEHKLFKKTKSDGSTHHPSAAQTIAALLKGDAGAISVIDQKLLQVASGVIKLRDDITHNPTAEIGDVSAAVWTSLVLLRSLALRHKIETKELFDQNPPIEVDVLNLLGWEHHNDYISFVEEALKLEYPDRHDFKECPLCGAMAVTSLKCEGCFQDVVINECPSCGDEFVCTPEDEHPVCHCGTQYGSMS